VTTRSLHDDAGPEALALARIAVFGMWLWHLLKDPLDQLAIVPFERFEPVGVLALLPREAWALAFSAETLLAFKVAMLVALVLLILGVRGFTALAALTCLALTVYQGLIRGFGKINHGELAMLYTAYVLVAFPCTHALALDRRPRPSPPRSLYRAGMMAAGFVLCLTYTFVGARRLCAGGAEIFLNGSIVHYVVLKAMQPGADGFGMGIILLEQPWLATLVTVGFPVVTVFELLSPVALVSRGFRWLWIPVMCGFHLATGLLMQIWFTANVVLVFLFVSNIHRLPVGILARLARRRGDGDP
jgi:hypothetical protein